MILAKYQGMTVEITGVVDFGAGREKRARIHVINAEPFTVLTHGGPMTTADAIVFPDQLTEVQIVRAPRASRLGKPYPRFWKKYNDGLDDFFGVLPSNR